ncbi:hypothetical protein ACWKSP_36270 [Micromonosporaceae bacterium Da 78-11]
MDFPEPDWVEAVGTWAGALGTFLALRYAVRSLRTETEARREDIQRLAVEQRKGHDAQARTVALHDPGYEQDETCPDLWDNFSIQVGNYGTAPVTDVTGVLTYLPSGEKVEGDPDTRSFFAVVPPGRSERLSWVLLAEDFPEVAEADELERTELFQVSVRFTDMHGVRWSRKAGPGEQPIRLAAQRRRLPTQAAASSWWDVRRWRRARPEPVSVR